MMNMVKGVEIGILLLNELPISGAGLVYGNISYDVENGFSSRLALEGRF